VAARRGEVARRAVAIALWLGLFFGLVPLGNAVVPDATKAKIPLQTFLLACQAATLVLGLGAALLLLRERRKALGLERMPGAAQALSTIASVPFVFVASSYIAIQIALPTLLEELKTRGAHASQQNAGEFGRALTQAPLLTTLLWGAVLGAAGEELFFRGLLWSTITDLTRRLLPESLASADGAAPRSAAGSVDGESADGEPTPRPTLARRALAILLSGGVATVLSAALFGWMHKDLPGGVGIVRVVSTTCLGLASGIVRQITGGVLACIALHALYNTLVIGSGRKWFAADKEPVLEGIPNTMVMLAVASAVVIGVVLFVRALLARRARSAFVPE
jgi:membrane protease YdiL (CAAX protease family)